MKMSGRVRQSNAALARLGSDRATAFFRAANADTSCTAVRLLNEDLDEGQTLQQILVDTIDSGFHISVTGRGARFRIEFGCSPGPMVGDGGEWDVAFDRDGHVVTCTGGGTWMS